jgi:hypothetical protein
LFIDSGTNILLHRTGTADLFRRSQRDEKLGCCSSFA